MINAPSSSFYTSLEVIQSTMLFTWLVLCLIHSLTFKIFVLQIRELLLLEVGECVVSPVTSFECRELAC